ncbi:MAG: nucleotide exchange factor GrpE [Chlorobi bacterium]|nr:nucleotide exchange factor GrpE [Chlorobiota bacterium]
MSKKDKEREKNLSQNNPQKEDLSDDSPANNEQSKDGSKKNIQIQQENSESEKEKIMEELKKKLEEKEKELQELKNKYLMALAEIENMRKKILRDKQSFYRSGIKDMALSLLHILDDVERAIEQVGSAKDIDAIKEGIMLIYRKFKQMLESKDIKPIESKGQQFNPELHEALMKIETDKDEDHMKVIDEIQKGYMIGDEVLRHSRVVVAVKKQEEEKGGKETENNKTEGNVNNNNDKA